MEFNKKYDRSEFINFLQHKFLPEDFIAETTYVDITRQTKYIRSVTKLGTCESLDLVVYEIRHDSLHDARVGLSKEAFRFLADEWESKALVLFIPKDNDANYRFSLITIELNETEEGKHQKIYSNPRRYSYYLGEGIACHTPNNYLKKLGSDKKTIIRVKDEKDLVERFSVEVLNKEFFNGYKDQYTKFLKTIADTKQHRDYVKKLLGRLVFLQFLQKKGWMGVPASNTKWEGGNKKFLSNLVERHIDNKRLLSDVFEPLFFGILNTKPEDRETLFMSKNWDIRLLEEFSGIPYLNGGLFEADDVDKQPIDFSYTHFKDLMDFFSQYNFTIDENDPDDSEVGIDPEMLGHIFENLLEDNKDKGAFYTPKEIVRYMCRQSVIQYLKTHESSDQYADAIEQLINDGVVNPILQNKNIAIRFTQLLKEVKVCDPAIGSGAFPMGILYVLYHAIHHLHSHAEPHGNFDSTQTKRDIIQNNIFGVDIEQGAVDIARLRFWLALVVDAEEPQPLPNLDYKITCGNSQIYRYALDMPIADVFEEYNRVGKENARKEKTTWSKFTLVDYKRLVVGYTEEHTDKVGLRSKINDIKNCFKTTLAQGDIRQRQLAEQRVYEYEAIPLFGKRKAEEDPIGYAAAKSKLNKLREKEHEILNNKKYEKSFEWRFEYPQLLDDKGAFIGFDIIIANPPYIKEGRMSKTFFEPYKDSPYYKGKMDIWYLFACNGLDLLNSNGVLCFIATNNWTTSFGASKLRDKVIKETRICNIVDFGAVMMFESASIQTMIMMFQKDKVTDDYTFDYRRLTAYKATEKEAIAILEPSYKTYEQAECYTPTIRRANFYDKNITFSQSDDILGDMSNLSNVIYLNDTEIAQGIVPNPDVVNSRNIKSIPDDEIISNDIKLGDGVFVINHNYFSYLAQYEKQYIKELYEPTNCHKYYLDNNITKDIIYITKANYKEDAPFILQHLWKYRFIMEHRRENQNGRLSYYHLHWPREESYFKQSEKILVPRKSSSPIFAYTNKAAYVMMAINIIQTNRVNLKYLTGLLNSKLIEFWLKNKGKMQGANYQLDKEPLQQIPIAVPSNDIQEIIAKLVDDILMQKKNNPQADTKSLESEIDFLVYKLYGLAYDEILIVDPETEISREEYENINCL